MYGSKREQGEARAADASSSCNVICLKWGSAYPASYVNILYQSVKRHLHRPFRFVCVTEDPSGLAEGVEVEPIPENPLPDSPGMRRKGWPNVFLKLIVLRDGFANLQGPTLFLDVDIVILDDIGCFFDYMPGKNCIIHNWVEARKLIFAGRPDVGNSSVFRFEAGKSNYIYETFLREVEQATDQKHFRTEQAFLTHAMKERYWWPEEWTASYKRHCRPAFPLNMFVKPRRPPQARILVFHGAPNPDEAAIGFRGAKPHHKVLPAPWILDDWRV
jgi:hypothetical protein